MLDHTYSYIRGYSAARNLTHLSARIMDEVGSNTRSIRESLGHYQVTTAEAYTNR